MNKEELKQYQENFKNSIRKILDQDLCVADLRHQVNELTAFPHMEVKWENWFRIEDGWIFTIGQLDDGDYFWTWFDFLNYEDPKTKKKYTSFARPNTIELLEICESADQSCLGGFIFKSKKELLEGILNDELMILDENNEPDPEDDFSQFYFWAKEFLESDDLEGKELEEKW
jgi:hypothetical protein